MWHATPIDQPGGGVLRLKQLGPRMHDALGRVEMARGRRLAEASHELDPAVPRAPPPPHSEWNYAMKLVHTHRIAPQ